MLVDVYTSGKCFACNFYDPNWGRIDMAAHFWGSEHRPAITNERLILVNNFTTATLVITIFFFCFLWRMVWIYRVFNYRADINNSLLTVYTAELMVGLPHETGKKKKEKRNTGRNVNYFKTYSSLPKCSKFLECPPAFVIFYCNSCFIAFPAATQPLRHDFTNHQSLVIHFKSFHSNFWKGTQRLLYSNLISWIPAGSVAKKARVQRSEQVLSLNPTQQFIQESTSCSRYLAQTRFTTQSRHLPTILCSRTAKNIEKHTRDGTLYHLQQNMRILNFSGTRSVIRWGFRHVEILNITDICVDFLNLKLKCKL